MNRERFQPGAGPGDGRILRFDTGLATGSAAANVVPLRRSTTILSVLEIGMAWTTGSSGGLDRAFHDLVEALPGQGVRVTGLVRAPEDAALRTFGRVHSFSAPRAGLPSQLLGLRRSFAELSRSDGFDLVAAHFALYAAPILQGLSKRPFVMHFHGPWAAEAAQEGSSRGVVAAKSLLERSVYRRADRVVVLSQAFRDLVVRSYGVQERRVHVIPGGVDLERFAVPESRFEARRLLGWPTSRPILVSVRRLTRRMGLDRLIEAMPAVVKRHRDVLLMIGGTGLLRPELEERIRQTDLARNVRLLGFVPDEDLPLAYRAADLNVVPTATLEGFGLVAAEALAAGTPSLVTPVGGLPEVVAPLSEHLVCASASPGDLAQALIDILDGRVCLPDSETCRAYATDRFSTERVAERTAELYRELVG
ncbi:Glycosyltransferase involved in cell wall bisynthesis [Faunimonas pinastri]|uniref:Glycosyltransferase involved in cell wall bisynthesis n=1 Tax=Faunimonas pinastri TaxID=1855383 RepID=A0A1H9PIS8_9HYPH|nr:glycosyltransferase family 4 protein [Faunimonas pinastri]SER47739.1 Glycosyltransferase involved in cell wall bisynthesis [Faunimonas pinastri]